MRPTSRLAVAILLAVLLAHPAAANEPDDLPPGSGNSMEDPAAPETDPANPAPDGGDGGLIDPEPDEIVPQEPDPAKPDEAKTDPTHAPGAAASSGEGSAPAPVPAAAADPNAYRLPIRSYVEANGLGLKSFETEDRQALLAYYDARADAALWVDKSGYTADAQALIAEFARADDWGLDAKAFASPQLAATPPPAEEALTAAEVQLSLLALRYGRQARGFRIDSPSVQLSSYLDRKPQLIAPAKLIAGLAAAPDKAAYLRGLHPQHPQFERLRQKLLALRKSTEKEAVVQIPARGPAIKPGASHSDIGLIRRRLEVDEPRTKADGTAADTNYYDDALSAAVKRFKEEHGITPATATITNALRTALAGGPAISEETLLANMEQWRWMPTDLGKTYVMVNIPEFTVRVVKDGKTIHEERVITGRTNTQTPIFSDLMRTVVFQPVWNVPDSIKVKELLPKLRAGYDAIGRQGLAVSYNGRYVDAWNVDWYRTDIRNFYIYQPPGPRNVLGVVKFLFPNKHAVYLHDTPSKGLFNQSVRTFSHGCMRVRNPVRLAEVLLAEDKGWNSSMVRRLVEDGPDNNEVALASPIPVHATYFTAWAEDEATVKTFPDVYGHQKRISLGLQGRWNEIEKNRDHLLPVRGAPIAQAPDDWDGYSAFGSGFGNGRPGYGGKPTQTVGDLLQKVFGGF